MVLETNVTRLFSSLDQASRVISEREGADYLDSLLQVGPYIIEQAMPDAYKKELFPVLEPFWTGDVTREDVRRAFQLAVLKGLQNTKHELHQMTPDAVAVFMGYLANQVAQKKGEDMIAILDLAVGSGNLLTTVLNQMEGQAFGIGVDVDDRMIRLAGLNADLQQSDLELFRQDAFRPLLIDPVDLVITDLPIGYYPDQSVAESFKVVTDKEKAYSHHMMIEQAFKHLKPAGFALLLVPNGLFEEDASKALYTYIQDQGFILGFLQLPSSLFKTQDAGRSILIVQKQGKGAKKPENTLMAQLPSFTNKPGFTSIVSRIEEWFKSYHHS